MPLRAAIPNSFLSASRPNSLRSDSGLGGELACTSLRRTLEHSRLVSVILLSVNVMREYCYCRHNIPYIPDLFCSTNHSSTPSTASLKESISISSLSVMVTSFLVCPAVHDLFVAGTVDVTLIFNGFLSAFINNCLLLWCQSIIQILVDAEEQTVIDCIPHGAVWLNFLYTCCIDCRKRIFLSFYGVLLQCCVSL